MKARRVTTKEELIIQIQVKKINGEYYSSSTILFCDFVGFTSKTEKMQFGELIDVLDSFSMV